VFEDRLRGYRRALKAHGLTYDATLVCRAKPDREGGYNGLQRLLAVHPALTAAVCYNDIVALGALAALGEIGRVRGGTLPSLVSTAVRDTAHAKPAA